jgi:hypothetical protein
MIEFLYFSKLNAKVFQQSQIIQIRHKMPPKENNYEYWGHVEHKQASSQKITIAKE